MSSINFDNIYLLFIAIPIIVILTVPFVIAVGKENRNKHNITSMVLHCLLALLLALGAAGTKVETVVTETDVYVVADVSYSADKSLDVVDRYIRTVSENLPKNSNLGVVCFAKNAQVLSRLGEPIISVKHANLKTLDQSETDISAALEFTGRRFPEDVVKRIVLITDGKQITSEESVSMMRTVEKLRSSGIHVDAMYLDSNLKETDKEVQLSDVNYTRHAYLNHAEKAQLTVDSTYAADVVVGLYDRAGNPKSEKAVHLYAGTNTVYLDMDTTAPGTFDYEARVEAVGDDHSPHNNGIKFTQIVSEKLHVLLVSDEASDLTYLKSVYGNQAEVTMFSPTAANLPYRMEDFCDYDEIVLSDFDISRIRNLDTFVESLEKAVSLYGKTLYTIGNLGIQNLNGEVRALADMLPVKYGASDDRKLYTLVLDISASINETKFALEKKAVEYLLNSINDEDRVAIVAFSGDVYTIATPTPASKRAELIDKLNTWETQTGTAIGYGLHEAAELIKGLTSYGERQIMLVTDGIDGTNDKYNPADVAADLYASDIYTSVIQLNGASVNLSGTQYADEIARRGGTGSAYKIANVTELENVFFSDIAQDFNEVEIKINSGVSVKKQSDGVLEGIKAGAFDNAYVPGFIRAKAKSAATTVLTVDYFKSNGSTVALPLLAHVGYGNGTVVSLTCKIGENWLRRVGGGSCADQLALNLMEDKAPAECVDYPYEMSVDVNGKGVHVETKTALLHNSDYMTISVVDQSDEAVVETRQMYFNSSLYYYDFVLPSEGRFEIDIVYHTYDETYSAVAFINTGYSEEYNSFAVFDTSELYKAVAGGGIVSEDGTIVIENDPNEIATYTLSLRMALFIACVSIFVIDIIIRKIKWNDIVSLFVKVNKEGAK